MAKVITVAHQKGGTGKTTLCVNLAHAFKEYCTTCLVDLDHQGSARSIHNSGKMKEIDLLASPTDPMVQNYQAVFVDTPPYLSDQLPDTFMLSDLVLIPTKSGIMDLMAMQNTLALVKQCLAQKPSLKALVVFNMVNKSTSLTGSAEEFVEQFGLPIAKTKITERVSFTRSVAMENGIYSTGDRKAAEEINDLCKEILFVLQNA